MKNDLADMFDLFEGNEPADTAQEQSLDELLDIQHARYRARFRDLANAMSQHPLLADQLAHSIDTLRRIADEDEAKHH